MRVEIDGGRGEGGGQMLRTALTLSAVTGQAFRMENIRAKRPEPGLKRQHLTCVRAVAEICGARTTEVWPGVRELEFEPGKIRGGEYRFEVGTAGSVTLVAQTVIPVLLRAGEASRVTVTGGTHVPKAPIWEHFEETYLPELRRMGAEVEARLVRYGFWPGAGGEVRLEIRPSGDASGYGGPDIGAFAGARVVGVVSSLPDEIAEAEAELAAAKLEMLKPEVETRRVESSGPGNYCFAELRHERGTAVISSVGIYERSRKAVANDVAAEARAHEASGGRCEKHLADQVQTASAALGGVWDFGDAVPKETAHYRTNREVIGEFLRRDERKSGEKGCGE